jgi:hypothetical protein
LPIADGDHGGAPPGAEQYRDRFKRFTQFSSASGVLMLAATAGPVASIPSD